MPTKKTVTKKAVKKAPAKKAVKKAVVKKVAKKAPAKKVAKKAPEKKAVKKAPAKKVSSKVAKKVAKPKKTNSKKELTYANEHTSFWLTDGQILNSLLALSEALDSMSDDVFAYHVRDDSNDFANWVGAVLCDENCAKELEKATSPNKAKTVVVKHLKYYVV
jgi:hypothetical protein